MSSMRLTSHFYSSVERWQDGTAAVLRPGQKAQIARISNLRASLLCSPAHNENRATIANRLTDFEISVMDRSNTWRVFRWVRSLIAQQGLNSIDRDIQSLKSSPYHQQKTFEVQEALAGVGIGQSDGSPSGVKVNVLDRARLLFGLRHSGRTIEDVESVLWDSARNNTDVSKGFEDVLTAMCPTITAATRRSMAAPYLSRANALLQYVDATHGARLSESVRIFQESVPDSSFSGPEKITVFDDRAIFSVEIERFAEGISNVEKKIPNLKDALNAHREKISDLRRSLRDACILANRPMNDVLQDLEAVAGLEEFAQKFDAISESCKKFVERSEKPDFMANLVKFSDVLESLSRENPIRSSGNSSGMMASDWMTAQRLKRNNRPDDLSIQQVLRRCVINEMMNIYGEESRNLEDLAAKMKDKVLDSVEKARSVARAFAVMNSPMAERTFQAEILSDLKLQVADMPNLAPGQVKEKNNAESLLLKLDGCLGSPEFSVAYNRAYELANMSGSN